MTGGNGAITAAELSGRLARISPLMASEPSEAIHTLQEILGIAQAQDLVTQEALALVNLASCYFRTGRYDDMMTYAKLSLARSRIARASQHEARALNMVGLAHQRFGVLDLAVEHFLDSLRLCQEILDHHGVSRAIGNIAMVHSKLGDVETALTLHEQALEVAQTCGSGVLTANMLASVMEDYCLLGEYQRALQLSNHTITFARNHGLSRYECFSRVIYGRILLALGRYPACVRAARAAYRVATWSKDEESMSEAKLVEGRALTKLGHFDDAEKCLDESLTTQEKIGNQEFLAHTHEALAELHEAAGNKQAAETHQVSHHAARNRYLAKKTTDRVIDITSGLRQQHHPLTTVEHPWTSELQELTKSLKRANTELSHRMAHDTTTGALTRQQFQAQLALHLEALDPDEIIGVAVLSLNQIKVLNEHFGETVITSALAEITQRIGGATRYGDFVGRISDDEFAVCLTHLARAEDIELILEKLHNTTREPFLVRGDRVAISAVIAGLTAPRDGVTPEELLSRADLTIQKMKREGKQRFATYNPALSEDERRRRMLSYDLRGALQRGEFELHYQAIIDVSNQHMDGVEALIRWRHPQLGLVPPDLFIELAEQGRQILDIGDWVIREACDQAMRWDFDTRELDVAVNVSAVQFAQPDFTASVANALATSNLPAHLLVLELTESMVLEDQERTAEHLRALQELGVRCALDDFGTGYSNVSLLQDLPVGLLKIDRSFLQKVTNDNPNRSRSETLIGTVVALAQNLNLQVVAEGVETEDQFNLLKSFHCEKAQGYLFHKPATPDEVLKTIELSQESTVVEKLPQQTHSSEAPVPSDGN